MDKGPDSSAPKPFVPGVRKESGDAPTPPPAPFIPFKKNAEASADAGGAPSPPAAPFIPFAKKEATAPEPDPPGASPSPPAAPFIPFAKREEAPPDAGSPAPPAAPFIPFKKEESGELSAQSPTAAPAPRGRVYEPPPEAQPPRRTLAVEQSSKTSVALLGVITLIVLLGVGAGAWYMTHQPKHGPRAEVADNAPAIPPGTLTITSNPGKAEVLINGEKKGLTPLTLKIKPDIYEVQVRKAGFLTATRHLGLEPGKPLKQAFTLQRFGTLSLANVPAGSTIMVDGEGVPRKALELAPGRHRILVRLVGYEDDEETVTLVSGHTLSFVPHLVDPNASAPQQQQQQQSHVIYENAPTASGNGVSGSAQMSGSSLPPPRPNAPSQQQQSRPQMPSGVVVGGNPATQSTPQSTSGGIPGL
ncbi:MAG: PEGA domain-containing protein [Candidatus Xenobia bacterium]